MKVDGGEKVSNLVGQREHGRSLGERNSTIRIVRILVQQVGRFLKCILGKPSSSTVHRSAPFSLLSATAKP